MAIVPVNPLAPFQMFKRSRGEILGEGLQKLGAGMSGGAAALGKSIHDRRQAQENALARLAAGYQQYGPTPEMVAVSPGTPQSVEAIQSRVEGERNRAKSLAALAKVAKDLPDDTPEATRNSLWATIGQLSGAQPGQAGTPQMAAQQQQRSIAAADALQRAAMQAGPSDQVAVGRMSLADIAADRQNRAMAIGRYAGAAIADEEARNMAKVTADSVDKQITRDIAIGKQVTAIEKDYYNRLEPLRKAAERVSLAAKNATIGWLEFGEDGKVRFKADDAISGYDDAQGLRMWMITMEDNAVREGEYAAAEAIRSVGQYASQLYYKLVSGKKLTPEQRRTLTRKVEGLFNNTIAAYNRGARWVRDKVIPQYADRGINLSYDMIVGTRPDFWGSPDDQEAQLDDALGADF